MANSATDTMSQGNLRRAVGDFLAAHSVLNLATVNEDGTPHAASLMYASDQLVLYWLSSPNSRHSRHIEANGQIAATIAHNFREFENIRGLQIAGSAGRVRDAREIDHALKVMAHKFAFFARIEEGDGRPGMELRRSSIYRLDCRRLTLIDNTIAFGCKEILEVEGEENAQ